MFQVLRRESGRNTSRALAGVAQGQITFRHSVLRQRASCEGQDSETRSQSLLSAGDKRSILTGTVWGWGCWGLSNFWGQAGIAGGDKPPAGRAEGHRGWEVSHWLSVLHSLMYVSKIHIISGSGWKGAHSPSVTIKYGIHNFFIP